jgi:hypothetical protein
VLHVACCLWQPNEKSFDFSRCYTEEWVEKLYRGFRRNLTIPFRFVCFTDRDYEFREPVQQVRLVDDPPGYGCMIEPFRLNEPTIIAGLDTLILEPIDHMARYCLEGAEIALPAHPSKPEVTINPVVFVPRGHRRVYDEHRGENDMEWMAQQPHIKTDSMWPKQIRSYKLHDLAKRDIHETRIVYFHGVPKMDALGHVPWVQQHWR